MSSREGRTPLVDSGASYHMISVFNLSPEELETRRPLDPPIDLNAATGVIWVEECVDIWFHNLGVSVTAVCNEIETCPSVPSLGKLVDEAGCSFSWKSNKQFYLYRGDCRVYCSTHHDCVCISANVEPDDKDDDETSLPRAELSAIEFLGGETSVSPVTPLVKSNRKARKPQTKKVQKADEAVLLYEPLVHDLHGQVPLDIGQTQINEDEIEKSVKERVKQRILKKRAKKKVVMSKACSARNIFTHFPRDPNSYISMRNKQQKAPWQSSGTKFCDALPTPEKFGDAGTSDHKGLSDDDKGRDGDRNSCVTFRSSNILASSLCR